MKFILKRTSNHRNTNEHFLKEDNRFYNKETIEERTIAPSYTRFVHWIELNLNELLLFIKYLDCNSIIISEDNHKKLYTIEIYDDYKE